VLHLGGRLAVVAQSRDHAGEDEDQPVGPRVDHPGLLQHRELFRGPRDGALSVGDRRLQHLREDRVLLLGRRLPAEPGDVHVREAPRHRGGDLAEDGEHRALRRVAHRGIGRVRGVGEGGRDQLRIDQLARAAGELLSRAADDLGEDHARVAAGAHQRGAGEHVDDLGPAEPVDIDVLEVVELRADRGEGERHVVAGVSVRDGEDVEVVDLLPASFETCVRRAEDPAKAFYRGFGHGRT
jgi:hypothetical protein